MLHQMAKLGKTEKRAYGESLKEKALNLHKRLGDKLTVLSFPLSEVTQRSSQEFSSPRIRPSHYLNFSVQHVSILGTIVSTWPLRYLLNPGGF